MSSHEIPDFVDYAGAYGYFMHVGEALDEVERLVHAGFPDAAIPSALCCGRRVSGLDRATETALSPPKRETATSAP